MTKFNHQIYDVIVIGAGPSGSSSAFFLKNIFDKVLLIDKKSKDYEKLCGGALAQDTLKHLEKYWLISRDHPMLGNSYNGGEIYYNFKLVKRVVTKDLSLNFCQRNEFDTLLAEKAQSCGVELHYNTTLTSIEFKENYKILTINGCKLKSKIVIAADGVHSSTSKLIQNSRSYRTKIDKNIVMAYEAHIPKEKLNVNGKLFDYPLIFFGLIKGYAWTFPKKNYLTIGIGGIASNYELKNNLKTVYNYLGINYDIGIIRGHYIPYGDVKRKFYSNGVFFVGDATGGLVDPIIAKGIYYSLLSGKILADSFEKNPDKSNLDSIGKEYSLNCKLLITNDLAYGLRIRKLLFWSTTAKLGMRLLTKSEKVGNYTMQLVSGQISFKDYWNLIIKSIPKIISKFIFNKKLSTI